MENSTGQSEQPSHDALRSTKGRLTLCALAVAAVLYAVYSYRHDDFYIVNRRGVEFHYHGIAANLFELMMLFFALVCVLPLIDFYDKRPVRPDYGRFSRWSIFAIFGLMGWGIFFDGFHLTLLPGSEPWKWLLRWFGWIYVGLLHAQLVRLWLFDIQWANSGGWDALASLLAPLIRWVAYFAAFLIGLIATVFLFLAGIVVLIKPSLLLFSTDGLIVVILLALGAILACWTYSIIKRNGQRKDNQPKLENMAEQRKEKTKVGVKTVCFWVLAVVVGIVLIQLGRK